MNGGWVGWGRVVCDVIYSVSIRIQIKIIGKFLGHMTNNNNKNEKKGKKLWMLRMIIKLYKCPSLQ